MTPFQQKSEILTLRFVLVHPGSIYVRVAVLQSVRDGLCDLARGRLPGPEPDERDRCARVELGVGLQRGSAAGQEMKGGGG